LRTAKELVSAYLNKSQPRELTREQSKKLGDFDTEMIARQNSFLGWFYLKFKSMLQESSLLAGIAKLFSTNSHYIERTVFDAYSSDMAEFDRLSNYYGNQYRGSFVLIYLMGALAVFVALTPMGFSFVHHFTEEVAEEYAIACVWIELVLIMSILVIHKVGATPSHGGSHPFSSSLLARIGFPLNRRWHERWIDYRILAERFRYMEILYPVGIDPLKQGRHINTDSGDWTWIYFAAKLESTSMNLSADFSAYKKRLHEIMIGQEKYHHHNAHRSEHIHHRLHTFATWLFYGTLLACAGHFVLHSHILTLVSGFFPALAAAMHGIIASGEFGKNAQISERMASEIKLQLARLDATDDIEAVKGVAVDFHNLVINEALSWKAMFTDKNVPLA